MPTRKIVLQHLVDGGTRTFLDDGCTPEGEPNIARQQLMNALAKTVVERDGNRKPVLGDDGHPIEWPLFKLAEPPPPMPYNPHDKKEQACAAADRFDRERLRRDGKWDLPSPTWLEVSARYRAARTALHEQYSAAQLQTLQLDVGRGIQHLLSQIAPAIPSAPVAPPAPEKGGAHGKQAARPST
jgi:hypothetical protein